MKVLYDYQAFTMQYFGGVSKCFCELISNLPKEVKTKIAIFQSNNVHLRDSKLVQGLKPVKFDEIKFRNRIPIKGMHKFYGIMTSLHILKGAEFYNHKVSVESLLSKDFDVFHPTFFDPYFLKYLGSRPWVITVHDMMPELFPQYYKRWDIQRTFKRKYLKDASAIVAVSETTKKDIIRLLGIPEDKITVIYHGGPKVEYISDPPLVDSSYFLYVGVRRNFKNFNQTVVDFMNFHKYNKNIKLVCTGSDFTSEERKFFKELRIEDSIIHYKASDSQLKNLYAHAIAFIYPSLYEGFGMPILEAYAYGCPVMLNDIEVFHEIAGDAAIFFSSKTGHSNLTKHMEEMFSMNKYDRNKLIEAGYKQLSKYSWKRSAEKLADLYKSVVSSESKIIV